MHDGLRHYRFCTDHQAIGHLAWTLHDVQMYAGLNLRTNVDEVREEQTKPTVRWFGTIRAIEMQDNAELLVDRAAGESRRGRIASTDKGLFSSPLLRRQPIELDPGK